MNYEYVINLNERGEFYADVRDLRDGETIFEIGGKNGTPLSELIADGFMDHDKDIEGLSKYLLSIGVITINDSILPS